MTTEEVAVRLGISRIEILVMINLEVHLRPARTSSQGYRWAEEEIQALQVSLNQEKRGRTQKE